MQDKPVQNLLVIEDNIGDARLVKENLRETDFADYELTYVNSLEELKVFKNSKFQAILLDLHLSHVKPTATFQLVNSMFPSTPIIVLTGLNDDNLAANIVRLGAQDYLVKGTYDGDMLQRSLKYAIYRKKAERRLANQKVKTQQMRHRADSFESESIRLTKVNEAKDVFLSIASHQLRTPATAVKQYIGMVLHGFAGEVPPKLRGFLETAYQSNERQIKIVDDLLKVARLDAGHITLHKSSTDIGKLLKSVITDLSEAAAIRHQTIETDIAAHVVADIDTNNIRMVFENILDNALKYSNDRGSVVVRAYYEANTVHCEFKDNGIGISQADQKKLFQKFSRIDDSFTYAPNGSGLGLYWAREVVKAHGGDITLESKKGVGSTFRIMLAR